MALLTADTYRIAAAEQLRTYADILEVPFRVIYTVEEIDNSLRDFKDYDYIVGDWAYGKLRLKGFYDKTNKKCSEINNFDNLKQYLKENCAFDCAYFVAKRKYTK